jgi:poly(3-hydroxybutyrate) depolymerase
VDGFRPEVTPSGWGEPSAGGLANEGGRCEDSPGAIPRKLPVTGVEYCVKAHPTCATEGAGCPLIVTINTAGALFSRVDGQGPDARAIVVELYVETDGDKIKDKLAELPRVIAQDYPGLDRSRVHAVGWSAGAGAVGRGLCHISKKSDFSSLGTTSDLYASVIALGGCGCASDYIQLAGNWHVMTFNGMEDPFNGGDSCEAGLRKRAAVNGCERPDAAWAPLLPSDPHAANGDGSSNAEVLDFGACKHGDVRGYRGKGEGHVVSFKKNFDPKISGYDTVWSFLQGKTK